MIRALLWFVIFVTLVIISVTVKFGKRTLYGHVKAIWSTPEAKDAREGIKEKTKEVVEELDDDKPREKPAPAPSPSSSPSKW